MVLIKKNVIILFFIIFLTINPFTIGLSKTNLITQEENLFDEKFDERIVDLMQEGHIPSLSACVVFDDKIHWLKGYGEQSNTNLVFDLGSLSKTFTATALLQLQEKDVFDLDDDVNSYLPFNLRNPHFPNDPITFRMLLTHTASFPSYDTPLTIEIFYNDLFRKLNLTQEEFPSIPQWIEEYVSPSGDYYSSDNWVELRPGTQNAYSNVGFCILGYLLERLSNQTYAQYLSEHIFQPLNMSQSGLNYTEYNSSSLADLYGWHPDEKMNIKYPHYSNEKYFGAGGVYTSITDLAKFLIVHMNGGLYNGIQLLNTSTIELMQSKQVIDSEVTELYERNSYFGLGWNMLNITDEYFFQGHSGRTVGSTSMMFYFEKKIDDNNGVQNSPEKIGIITLVNQGNIVIQPSKEILYSDSESTIGDIFGLISDTASGKKPQESVRISFSFSPVIVALGLLTVKLIIRRKSIEI